MKPLLLLVALMMIGCGMATEPEPPPENRAEWLRTTTTTKQELSMGEGLLARLEIIEGGYWNVECAGLSKPIISRERCLDSVVQMLAHENEGYKHLFNAVQNYIAAEENSCKDKICRILKEKKLAELKRAVWEVK